MSSFNEERVALERLLSDFLYIREQTTGFIERSGQSGPLADDARQRLRAKAYELCHAAHCAADAAERGEL